MNNDNIYWLFSAAAQSISAFVAFLLTGYAFVHTLMETARERDDTLEEIHVALRQKHHFRLTLLASVTGLAIILSLLVVFLNRWIFAYKTPLLVLTTAVDLASIVGGLAFVVSIVDPSRYERTAANVLEENREELQLGNRMTSSSEFFGEFIRLERLVRDYLRARELYVPSRGAPRMSFSFRQMGEALLQNEIIDRDFFNELIDINKYRNLVFHGHVEQADEGMVRRTRAASTRIEQLQLRGVAGATG
jgi:hypothetical protein